MYIDCLLLTTACMLAATLGCQCGALPGHSPSSQSQNSTPTDADRLESIKQNILNKLGMERETNVERLGLNASLEERRNILDVFRKRYQELEGESRDLEEESRMHARQYYTFSHTPNDVASKKFRSVEGGAYLFFNLIFPQSNHTNHELAVSEATLRLNIRHNKSDKLRRLERQIAINIYRVVERKVKAGRRRRFRKRLVYSQPVVIAKSSDVTVERQFDLVEIVRKWVRRPSSNHGLVITASSGSQHLDWITFTSSPSSNLSTLSTWSNPPNASKSSISSNSNYNVPQQNNTLESTSRTNNQIVSEERGHRFSSDATLDVFTRLRPRRSRSKRSAEKNDCGVGGNETRCCRKPMWVSFKDIGWDSWIIAPEGYQAYYCNGLCPHRFKVANHHSGVQSLMHNLDPTLTPAPCCAATRLSSLSLAHYNADGHPVISVFDDIIVDECKCT